MSFWFVSVGTLEHLDWICDWISYELLMMRVRCFIPYVMSELLSPKQLYYSWNTKKEKETKKTFFLSFRSEGFPEPEPAVCILNYHFVQLIAFHGSFPERSVIIISNRLTA